MNIHSSNLPSGAICSSSPHLPTLTPPSLTLQQLQYFRDRELKLREGRLPAPGHIPGGELVSGCKPEVPSLIFIPLGPLVSLALAPEIHPVPEGQRFAFPEGLGNGVCEAHSFECKQTWVPMPAPGYVPKAYYHPSWSLSFLICKKWGSQANPTGLWKGLEHPSSAWQRRAMGMWWRRWWWWLFTAHELNVIPGVAICTHTQVPQRQEESLQE